MARLSNNSDRDFLASPGEDFADIAKLFAYQPPELNEFFADPIVQMTMTADSVTENELFDLLGRVAENLRREHR